MDALEAAGLAAAGIVTAEDLRRVGEDPRLLQRSAAAGALERVRRGHYVEGDRWRRATPAERHRIRVAAASRLLPDDVFSHESAAAVWGIPLLGRWPDQVHVVGRRTGGGRTSRELIRHGVDEPPDGVVHDSVRVTSAARTIVDLARTRPFAAGVVAADHGLRTGLVTGEELASALGAVGGRGRRRATAVIASADRRAESVGESLSRARMLELGLELPELQVVVRDADGFVGRVDFWWERVGLVGEFDGRFKYGVDGVDGAAAEERLWNEKLREDRLRATGRRVSRWTWSTALDPRRFLAHLTAAGVRPSRAIATTRDG